MSTFKVLTFNMQFGQGWDASAPDEAPVDLDRTIAQLRALDADVMLLQEVERVEPSRGQVQPPPNYTRLKAAFPDYDSVFSYPPADPRELPFGYGLAIFSKSGLTDATTVPLPAPDLEFDFMGARTRPTDRVLIGARTRIHGQEVQLYNTHLQAFFIINHTSDDFPTQRERVSHLLRDSRLPTLLGGDFNAAPGEGTVEALEAVGYRSVQRKQITWHRMPYVLDHLLHNSALKPMEHAVIPTEVSDHMILVAEFCFTGRKRGADTRSPFAEAGRRQ